MQDYTETDIKTLFDIINSDADHPAQMVYLYYNNFREQEVSFEFDNITTGPKQSIEYKKYTLVKNNFLRGLGVNEVISGLTGNEKVFFSNPTQG